MKWFKKEDHDTNFDEVEQELPIKEKVILEDKIKLLPLQLSLGNIFEAMIYGEDYEPLLSKAFPIQEAILKWNIERNNLEYDEENELAMLKEEELEFELADNEDDMRERIDALADIFVVATGTLAKSGMANQELSAELKDFYALYLSIPKQIRSYGFDFVKVMQEVIKEISSRRQDPIQAKRWAEIGNNGEKWQKDLNQDPETLYKADFCKCKVCKSCGKK